MYQIVRVQLDKHMEAVEGNTADSVVGNGKRCVDPDIDLCGDGTGAMEAKLHYPKGTTRKKNSAYLRTDSMIVNQQMLEHVAFMYRFIVQNEWTMRTPLNSGQVLDIANAAFM